MSSNDSFFSIGGRLPSNDNMSILKVGTFNCRGLNDFYLKERPYLSFFENCNLSIIFLQETKLKPENEEQYINEWYNKNCIFNSTPGGKSGTAILFNTNAIKVISEPFIDIEGRVIAVDINIFGNVFHLVNSYGPNDYELKVPFLNRLYLYLNTKIENKIIWAGDHNIATDPILDRHSTNLASDHGTTEFFDILNTFDLKDTCRTIHPNKKFFTYRRGESKSRIDKICVSEDCTIQTYYQEDICFSDHELVIAKICYTSHYKNGRGVWRNNTKYYSDPDFVQKFEEFFENSKNVQMYHNLPKWWSTFKYKFRSYFINYSKQKCLFEKRDRQMKNQGFHNLIQLLNQNPSSVHLNNEYTKLKKQIVNDKIKDIKEKIFQKDADHIMKGDKPTKCFFDQFKSRKEHVPIKVL